MVVCFRLIPVAPARADASIGLERQPPAMSLLRDDL